MNPQTVIPKVYSFKMESILNVKTQKIEAADYWLSQGKSIVQKLEISLTEKRKQYACPCCKTPIFLKQNKRRLPYFAHPVLEDTQACKLLAAKVKPKKKTAQQSADNPVSDVSKTTNQEANPKARIIAFHPDYSNWDSSLGVTSINYFVTSNDIPANNDLKDKYQEFDDTFPESIQETLDAHDWEQVNFEFLEDEQEATVHSSYHVWDEDLNIQWLLDRFNGNIPEDYNSIEDQDLVKLIFEQKLSRSINNLRTRILDLKICGFQLPENILDVMVGKGLIKRLEETSQVQFERAS